MQKPRARRRGLEPRGERGRRATAFDRIILPPAALTWVKTPWFPLPVSPRVGLGPLTFGLAQFYTDYSRNDAEPPRVPKESKERWTRGRKETSRRGLRGPRLRGRRQMLSRQCRSCVAISSYIWLLGLRRRCLQPPGPASTPIGWWHIPIL
ncbi:hypothetical protein EYF80_010782 [Liparis tanakae]|uniref:Uncharacterized protein n=1 Tax=Liparis tanakae TaxID=230148 RepID=A0A4Z2IPK3_9TELE|nr:hypothetical protein EYF80_010782 [Liparis tanakae]